MAARTAGGRAAVDESACAEAGPGCGCQHEASVMSNPWTKKNPFMSMWLSGANAVANRARGHATAAAKRHGVAVARQAARGWTANGCRFHAQAAKLMAPPSSPSAHRFA